MGKYPVKIYNVKRELIYQKDNGGDNAGMTPTGGVIVYDIIISSIMETIKRPNTLHYAGGNVVSQTGHSKELWDYYWTSYSRGDDGKSAWNTQNFTLWHNTYLDGYIVLRSKSIYDPCPYGYRTPTNGTYNNINSNLGWTNVSYTGGLLVNNNWFQGIGYRSMFFQDVGIWSFYKSSTLLSSKSSYVFGFSSNTKLILNAFYNQSLSFTLRCIEDATVKADDSCSAARTL